MDDLKQPSSGQCFHYLVNSLRDVLAMGESFSQPHVQRPRFCVIRTRAMLLALNDIIPSSTPNVVNEFTDMKASPWSSIG